jgi:hypothetical protein
MGERYPTPEALHQGLKEILDLALYEVANGEPFSLRFVTPASRDKRLVNENYNDYRLTTQEEHLNGIEYNTVSNSWKHEQISDDGSPLPRYHISGPSKTNEPTPISCPGMVFHRAMVFARSRRFAFVWIDQECTDQADLTDIQEHLKIMHRVYEESEWTVTSLSVAMKKLSLI